MTAPEPRRPASFDADRLGDALDRINRARRLSHESTSRLRALLDGFQSLLEVEPERRSVRDFDGAGALAELEALLGRGGGEDGIRELQGLLEPVIDRLVEGLLAFPERRLAVYGSLAPGETNHHHVSMLVGKWTEGVVSGTLHDQGWGAKEGYPAFVWDAAGPDVPVAVLESAALVGAWDRLDTFEGSGYRRILVTLTTEESRLTVCNLYELSEPMPPG